MGFQCVPQTIGLVRGTPKEGQKNRANGAGILAEMAEERYSNSTTIDREKSWANKYYGEYSSGIETWVQMVEDADEYRSTYTDKNGTQRSRKLPAQSIIAVATIINPPEEATKNWSTSDHDRFQQDAEEVLSEIEPRIYARKNRRLRCDHFDEGFHSHYVHDTKDETGRYCGSVYDAKLRTRMAVEFAQKMRERGWPIDDPSMTDWNKYGELKEAEPYAEGAFQLEKPQQGFDVDDWVAYANPEYRSEIDAKRRKSGLSQPNFKAQKEHEERLSKLETQAREVEQQVAESNEWLDEANRQAYAARQYAERMDAQAKKQQEFTQRAKQQATEYSKVAREKMLPEVERIQREANADAEAIRAQAELEAKEIRAQASSETKQLKEDLDARETELEYKQRRYVEDRKTLDAEKQKVEQQRQQARDELEGLNFLKSGHSFQQLWRFMQSAFFHFLKSLGMSDEDLQFVKTALLDTTRSEQNQKSFESEFLRAVTRKQQPKSEPRRLTQQKTAGAVRTPSPQKKPMKDLSFGTNQNLQPQPQKDDPQPGY